MKFPSQVTTHHLKNKNIPIHPSPIKKNSEKRSLKKIIKKIEKMVKKTVQKMAR